jgi:hypothetical protein
MMLGSPACARPAPFKPLLTVGMVAGLWLALSASACEKIAPKPWATPPDSGPAPTMHWEADYPVKPRNPGPLLAAIEIELRKLKPDIENTQLVSLVPAWAYGLRGHRQGSRTSPRMEDPGGDRRNHA